MLAEATILSMLLDSLVASRLVDREGLTPPLFEKAHPISEGADITSHVALKVHGKNSTPVCPSSSRNMIGSE
jgi:hypothetical protein